MYLDLSWNYDKILSDPLVSGKLYYKKPFTDSPIVVGTVNDVAPTFSVTHNWNEGSGGNGLADILTNVTKHIQGVIKSIDKFASGTKALATGVGKTSKASNIVINDLNNKFKQFEGSEYQVTLPQLTITLLPTDQPHSQNISTDQTPAGKLLRLMSFQAGQTSNSKISEGSSYSSEDRVGPSGSSESAAASSKMVSSNSSESGSELTAEQNSTIEQLMKGLNTAKDSASNTVSHPYNELKKIFDTKIIGSSAYVRNQILTIAPFDFVRSYDTTYPVYLPGTVSLVINGIIYKNLLVSEINTECSNSRIINEGKDFGPSWIKCTLTFVPAIGWTVRDIEDILLQLSNSVGYSAADTKQLY